MKRIYRKLRALIYKYLSGRPDEKLKIIGITGTDGKSTTSELIYQILKSSDKKVGLISTIGIKIFDGEREVNFDTGLHTTTPTSKEIYLSLKQMNEYNIEYCILETTSHALHQDRIFGIAYNIAAFTNISSDHLDYHKTLEEYISAKCKIIKMTRGAVISNFNDASSERIERETIKYSKSPVFYGIWDKDKVYINNLAKKKIYKAFNILKEEEGYSFDVKLKNLKFNIYLPLDGRYNISNAMCAISIAVELGLPVKGIIEGIKNTQKVKGRMSIVQSRPFKVTVDFAHTANGVYNVLSSLKENMDTGRLITMFGCPGDRDKSKRSIMGANASEFSDIIILTSDDSRNEPFDSIVKDIKNGIAKKFQEDVNLFIIESREEAIKFILTKLAKENDTIALLGKGHEQSNAINGEEIPWDEENIAKKYLKANEV